MTIFAIAPYLNTGNGSCWEILPGDTFATTLAWSYLVEAEDLHGALAKFWAIGNRASRDLNGKDWPRWVRSLSRGDIAKVFTDEGCAGSFAVERFGWAAAPDPHTLPSSALSGGAKPAA